MTTPDTHTDAQPTPPKRRHSWLAWLCLLTLIIGVACWFQLVHQQRKSTNNYSQLQSSFHQTLMDNAQQSQAISALQKESLLQTDQLQALQAALNRLQASHSGYEEDIALQQVNHYLVQANLSLMFDHNIASAITLLQASDQRLNAIPDTRIIPLRQTIASSIVQLQAIPKLDAIGLLTKLSALRDAVANIPLFAVDTKTQIFHTTVTPTSMPIQTAQGVWQKTLETIKSLIIIRNRQTTITPLISSEQEAFLRQNLQLMFQQAQWAVLQHQQDIYSFSLTQADEWIQRYFADNATATTALQNNIKELQKINLEPKTPDLGALVNQLHALQLQINKSRTLAPTTKTAEKAPEDEDAVSEQPSEGASA